MRRGARLAAVLAMTLASAATLLPALERLQRRFGVDEGLPFSEIISLAQDARGFIWIETPGRLFRYDGIEMRPWPRNEPGSFTGWVVAGPDGAVLVTDYQFRLFRVAGEDLEPVTGPNGSQAAVNWPPRWDAAGRLWLIGAGQRIWIRSAEGRWSEYPLARLDSETPHGIESCFDGSMLVITDKGIWRLREGLDPVRLAGVAGVGRALLRHDGSIAALMPDGRVIEIRDGATRPLYSGGMRPIDILERSNALWVSYDGGLAVLRPGEEPEWLGQADDVPGGGVMLVDREGSLWLGTYRGLRQFPAPDTVAYTPTARRLARTREGLWVDSWGGLSLLRTGGMMRRSEHIQGTITSALCVASDGALWLGARDRFLERRDGRFVDHALEGLRWVRDCAVGTDGNLWLTTNLGLFSAAASSGPGPDASIREMPWPPGITGNAGSEVVLEEPAGLLWVAEEDRVCHGDARTLLSGSSTNWDCTTIEGSGGVNTLERLATGSLWAGTLQGGVFRRDPARDRWEALPGSRDLPTRVVRRIRRSPSGGAWVITFGAIIRVEERPDSPDGWEIVERPSSWQGLMIRDAEDILEDPGGDLWITTLAGVVHIPPEVRRSRPVPPPVELVDVLQDGRSMAWQDGLLLPFSRNRIELRFAALSYRDPSLLRYQVRLRPDAPWSDASGPPSFRFVDLPPGSYHAEVRASLDGSEWSASSAGLSFTVRPPFWRTWWFAMLAALAACSAAYALYRYRLAQLLKLERMRTRIASDLHDDIGSSLSRIAIQSELVRRPAVLKPHDAERLLSDIGDSARSLVDAMSDIVWSIDPARDDLASLTARVRQFALDMLEPLGVSLALTAPDAAERIRLAPEQRRHLYLFFKEAINNIARHANCRNVAIRLDVDGARLGVEVRDDGKGLEGSGAPGSAAPSARATRGGHGMDSMRERARLLGGSLSIESATGGGTTLRLTCPLTHVDA